MRRVCVTGPLQCLISNQGYLIAWGLPEAKLSMALLRSSTDGSESNSTIVGRHSNDSMASRAAGDTV